MPGHDGVGELDHGVENVGPHRRIALERKRGDPEEAEVTGEADVDVGDEDHEVTGGVSGCGEDLDARGELRGAFDEVGDGTCPQLGEVVELFVERGHELLVPVDGHRFVERVARDRGAVDRSVRERLGAADVIDVRVGQDRASHRRSDRGDCGGERLPL